MVDETASRPARRPGGQNNADMLAGSATKPRTARRRKGIRREEPSSFLQLDLRSSRYFIRIYFDVGTKAIERDWQLTMEWLSG